MYANFGRLASSSSVEFREDHVAEEEEDDDDNDEGEGLVRGRSRERKRMLEMSFRTWEKEIGRAHV